MTVQKTPDFLPMKALVLAGDDGRRAHLRALLQGLAMTQIDEAAEAADCLRLIGERRPDFLICDLDGPAGAGIALVKKLRCDETSPNPYLPIVMTLGQTDRQAVVAMRDAGVTEILARPVKARTLSLKIAEILERPRPYVRSPSYFGPDRRRKRDENYPGPFRRKEDPERIASG